MEYLPLIFIIISIAVQIFKRANKKNDGMTEEERFEAMKRRIEEAQRRQKEKELEKERGYSLPPVLETPEAQPAPKAEPRYESSAKTGYEASNESSYKTGCETAQQTSYEPSRGTSYDASREPGCDPQTGTQYKSQTGTQYKPSSGTSYQSGSSSTYQPSKDTKVDWPSYERDRQDNHGGQAMAAKLKKQIGAKAQAKTAAAQNDLIVARSTKPLYGKRRFSPLQQGILWATILDRPLSQQRNGGYRGIRSRV